MPTTAALPHVRALVLAAGRGERMRPLTDSCPKPLLEVRGQPLAQWWVQALRAAGVARIVINTGWLGEMVEAHFSALPQPAGAAPIHFSSEARDFGHALETAGGVVRALPLLAPEANSMFWVIAGDVFAPGFALDVDAVRRFAAGDLAHLWLVPNPPHKAQGDFGINAEGRATLNAPLHTFSGIGLHRRALFEAPWCDIPPGNPQGVSAPLAPLLRRAIAAGRVGATLYSGAWSDVGTPQRLEAARRSTPATMPA